MKRFLALALVVTVLSMLLTSTVAADAPIELNFVEVFDDVNPCTGDIHTVTIAITVAGHFHNGRFVGNGERTITTSPTGFVGRGTDSVVDNGEVFKLTLNDMLENEAGDQIRAHFVLLLDLSTDPPTEQVVQGALDCVAD